MVVDADTRYFETEFANTTTAGAFVTFAVTGTFSAESTVDFNDYVLVDMKTQEPISWDAWDILAYDRLGLYPKARVTNPAERLPVVLELLHVHSKMAQT